MSTRTVKIVEVGLRDGLQNESVMLSLETRIELIKKLSAAGIRHIEAGAFVSPKWVPQMADSAEIWRQLKAETALLKKNQFPFLVPNLKGLDQAIEAKVKEISIFAACSDGFSLKNINCTVEESLLRYREVVKLAKKHKLKVRGYLSTAFGCPFDGKVSPKTVARIAKELFAMGVYEVSVGDTIGVGTPSDVSAVSKSLTGQRISKSKIAFHFHDTRGTALANTLRALDLGYRIFDSSIGGLGGCPYAPGAQGNLATGDLVYLLEGMGYKSGVDLAKLVEIYKWLEPHMNHPLAGHIGRAALPPWKN